MSNRQWKRLDAVERIGQGRLTLGEAAEVLGLSKRQVRRLRRTVERRGAKGVVHGNTGRAPAHRLGEEVRDQVVELRRKRYAGFNDQHFTEKLREVEGVAISRSSVQRLLRAAGIGPPRRRRAPKHRRRRDRKPQAGLMILWDGSRHEWLEERGPMLCLMGAIDDATGELLPGAHFVEQECAAGYLRVLKAIAEEKGLPYSAYMDRHGSLKRNDEHWTLEEELRGVQDPTQVGRALQALEIEVIYALSPQGEGTRRADVGNVAGPVGLRTATGGGHDHGRRQHRAGGLPHRSQPALRDQSRRGNAGVARGAAGDGSRAPL
jgi:transposase